MWKTWVQSLDCEDPLEEGMATHFCILAWRIPVDRGAWLTQESGVVSRGNKGLISLLELRRVFLGAH